VIDLHLHTTASDGRLRPSALIARAAEAGLTVISVTDHDTTAGLTEARHAATALDIRLITGIEVTAVEDACDVHVLGYFYDPGSNRLEDFLRAQRADRIRRVTQIGERLAALGRPIDLAALLDSAARQPERSIGRPRIADALVAAGHAADWNEAFDRWLAAGRPAFVPRRGATVAEAVEIVHAAGGIASLAHPGLLGLDEQLPRFAAAGLDALEARHSEHDHATEQHYRQLAATLGLAVSGGSDFHGESIHDPAALGVVTLDPRDLLILEQRAASAPVRPSDLPAAR
jgi:hypothetical protein